MSKSIYISSFEDMSGKAAAMFGLMELAKKKYGKVAIFRPVITRENDKAIQTVLEKFSLGMNYADTYAFTMDEVRELLNSGKREYIIETVIKHFKALEKAYDFVLCIGTDFKPATAAFEFALNSEFALNTGTPMFLVLNTAGQEPDEVRDSALMALGQLEQDCVDVLAVILNKSSLTDAEAKEVAAELQKQAEAGSGLGVYNIPLSACSGESCLMTKIQAGEATVEEAVAEFTAAVDNAEIMERIEGFQTKRVTPKLFEFQLLERAQQRKMRIVLPEGQDERVLRAADDLLRREVAALAILGDEEKINSDAKRLGLDLSRAQIINPVKAANFQDYAETYAELRKHKGISIDQAKQTMSDATYYGTMMVYKGDMDGMVSGAINTTGHTIRPAFEFIKTKVKGATVSSCMLMCLKDRIHVFGDCAVLPNPTPKEVADVAISSAETAKIFGVEPRVAMLSYSTGSSGKGPDVDAVIESTNIAKEAAPDLPLEGPIQYDAAIDPGVAATKLPNSKVAGKATVFVFPDLNTGNNTYKAVQRAANALAIGPILQGLRKPVNDLSRGCTVPDIINTVAITAIQAQAEADGK